ncbi:MAG TPA: hypothetical protein VM434_14630 [Beijerinckiaceae bacterium]|nr:hypothetical protein [Beijerinckiaceae bacterium]
MHVAASQNQKEVTINDAIDRLDLAANDTVDVDCSAGNTSITAADYRQNFLIRLTGNPGADFTVTVPDGKRIVAVHNTTSRAATLRTQTLGSTVALRLGELSIVGSRGTNLVALAASAGAGLYDLGLFIPGQPPPGALVFQFVFPRAVSFAAAFAGSAGRAGVAATAPAALTIRKNGANIGTIEFATGAPAATFTGAATSFSVGDTIELLAPAPQDATLADLSLSLVGSRT